MSKLVKLSNDYKTAVANVNGIISDHCPETPLATLVHRAFIENIQSLEDGYAKARQHVEQTETYSDDIKHELLETLETRQQALLEHAVESLAEQFSAYKQVLSTQKRNIDPENKADQKKIIKKLLKV